MDSSSEANSNHFDSGDEPGWTVVIGDVIASRAIRDRARFQHRLQAGLDDLRASTPDLAGGPALTGGDEFKALFRRAGSAIRFVLAAQALDLPARLRFGIGFGGLSVYEPVPPAGQATANLGAYDGRAFHNARAAIDTAKRKRRFAVAVGFGASDALVTAALELATRVQADRTQKQQTYVTAVAAHENQQDAAHALGVSPSTLSAALARAKTDEVAAVHDAVIHYLDHGWSAPDA